MSARFFVDERVGCIAIRDRDQTDPEYHGLHSDTPGVVWYEHGIQIPHRCPTCGHTNYHTWDLTDGAVDRAKAECARLNAIEEAAPIMVS